MQGGDEYGRRVDLGPATGAADGLSDGPRVIGAKRPKVPFGVSTLVLAAPVVLVLGRADDPGARGLRLGEVGVAVRYDHIDCLSDWRVWMRGGLMDSPPRAIVRVPYHEHKAAVGELRMVDAAAFAFGDEVLVKSEGVDQKLDGGLAVFVAKGGNYGLIRHFRFLTTSNLFAPTTAALKKSDIDRVCGPDAPQ